MKTKRNLTERFFEKVAVSGKRECWLWTGWRDKFGYGKLRVYGAGAHMAVASRISWEIHTGKSPGSKCVLHKCDNPQCVNPNHLFLGTRTENNLDMFRKKRNARLEKNGRALLNRAQVRDIRKAYAAKTTTYGKLSKTYSVSLSTIKRIVNNETWVSV